MDSMDKKPIRHISKNLIIQQQDAKETISKVEESKDDIAKQETQID